MSSRGRRTAITLPPDEYERILEWLDRKGWTFSEFARRSMEYYAKEEGLVVDLSVQMGGKREGAGRPVTTTD